MFALLHDLFRRLGFVYSDRSTVLVLTIRDTADGDVVEVDGLGDDAAALRARILAAVADGRLDLARDDQRMSTALSRFERAGRAA